MRAAVEDRMSGTGAAGDEELVAIAQVHARDDHLIDLTAEVILGRVASAAAHCRRLTGGGTTGVTDRS